MLFNFDNITYSLGIHQDRKISVSGDLNDKSVMVVRGPSGSGKSTLLRVLSRLQNCSAGEAYLQGQSWKVITATNWRSKVHYLAQKPALFDGTVAENLTKPFEIRSMDSKQLNFEQAKAIMEDLLLPAGLWEQDARTLSGGEAARLAFVRALLIDPTVLLLDEPTSALDEKSRKAFYNVLSGWLNLPGKGALLISHNNDFHELSRISFLDIESTQGGI